MSMRHEGLLMLTVPIYHSSCNRRRQLVQLLSNRCPAVSLTEGGLFEILCTCHSSSLKYQEAFAILCHAMNRQPDKAVATNMFEAILRLTATVLPEAVLILLLWAFVLNDCCASFKCCESFQHTDFDQLLCHRQSTMLCRCHSCSLQCRKCINR